MPDVETRLAQCFAMVFPKLNPAAIRSASTDNVEQWDSLASITLAALIDEEFGIRIPPEELPGLLSFQEIAQYLSQHAGEGPSS
jgi:acyl carrier protein